MANTLTSTTYTILAQKALEAFVSAMTPVTVFAQNFGEGEVQRGDKVKVLFVDADTAAANDWVAATGYTIDASQADGLDITINKRKFVSWGLTSQELADNPQINMERWARQKGYRLAKAVLQDIWSLVTLANYGAAAFTGAAAVMDSDSIADIETICDDALWPDMDRALILKPSYHNQLTKDSKLAGTIGLEQSGVLSKSRIPQVHNFDLHKSPFIPDNSENLRGMAVHPDAILLASRVIVPEDPSGIIRFERLADPMGSGLTLAFREWTDPVLDQTNRVLEFTYGKLKGNPAGCKRIVSA
jgi:hypothetical protein